MSSSVRVLIVNNIKLPINASFEEAFSVAKKRLTELGMYSTSFSFSIYKRSVDARNKNDIKFVYSVAAEGPIVKFPKERAERLGVTEATVEEPLIFQHGEEKLSAPPLIVGSGPCGLFAALILAEEGYRPILIERGGSIRERNEKINTFKTSHLLDADTNIQFGAGGAGTYSDGKLVTRVNDPYSAYVLKRFVEFGAPREIMYIAKPHVGTDILSGIVDAIIDRIIALGGQVHYHTKFLGTKHTGVSTVAVTSNGDIRYGALILAVGHSARDTYASLMTEDFLIEPKAFSVGMRVEHLAYDIDRAMYGDFAGNPILGHAEYNLSSNTKERGVYTFCMCPGGEVVAAASEELGVVVNGMSEHSRSGRNSNSAVVCSIFKEDYGSTPEKAIQFQRMIERAAYKAGGEGYRAPIITVGDFLSGRESSLPDKVIPTYMNGENVKIASPEKYLPRFVCNAIKSALCDFDKKIKGFASDYAILTGAETRTSAPVRILRDSDTRIAVGQSNVYPCGEGAGYAGGITSAAIDGIRTALAVINRYRA